ncbi:MAG: DNA-directed RNA polymerase subunit delta [Syntrophomonadaceae bacterium]|nr:DNA-directed RNA polymerase subunit delta [Syntrophomonadaceae bacterium]
MMTQKKSEADWAVEIMSRKQEAMFYSDLINEIADMMGKKKDTPTLTSIYTRINLDNRLVYQGEGFWFYDTSRLSRPRV